LEQSILNASELLSAGTFVFLPKIISRGDVGGKNTHAAINKGDNEQHNIYHLT
jgi:hypothetical protein